MFEIQNKNDIIFTIYCLLLLVPMVGGYFLAYPLNDYNPTKTEKVEGWLLMILYPIIYNIIVYFLYKYMTRNDNEILLNNEI